MGLLQRVWNWFTSSTAGRPRKAHPDLYPIDVERIAKDLRLVDEATRLGEAGLPSSEATVISGPEAAVVQRVEKARQDYVDWAALRLNVLNTDLGRRNITKDVNRARQADLEFERKASALLAEQDAVARALGEVARRRQTELDTFRLENKLTREAHYPTTTRSYFQFSLLLVLMTVEGILNAKFFAQGLDTGLLGGFVEAGIMAAINVTIAFVMGKYAIRYINHRKIHLKIFGFLTATLSLTIMVSIALGIAHYRDSLTDGTMEPAKVALETFIESPFRLKDFFSWALFAITLLFGLGALFDGLFHDDLYPGYGSISKRTQSAIDDHEAELHDLRTRLEELKNDELDNLDATMKRAQVDVAAFESLIHDKQMAASRLDTALRDADNSLDALLKKFRTENELHRKGARTPAYFNEKPDLLPIESPEFDTRSDNIELQQQRNLVSALLSEEQDIRARIQAAFTRQFDRLKPLDTLFHSREDI